MKKPDSGIAEIITPRIEFDKGSILIDAHRWNDPVQNLVGEHFSFDERIGAYRSLAINYRNVVLPLHKNKVDYEDCARQFGEITSNIHDELPPLRPYQQEALDAWIGSGKRGCITLPTGSGKTRVALEAIARAGRSTLVVVPTLDLVAQWLDTLTKGFSLTLGQWGGGQHNTEDITVSTYDSARIHVEREGSRFGTVIFDECHHLPSEQYSWIAKMMIAPFRLGLSATPERSDGGELRLRQLIGEEVYRSDIRSMRGSYLSDYEVCIESIPLDEEEWNHYKKYRTRYLNFVRDRKIDFSDPQGWANFLMECHSSPEGRAAYQAYLSQNSILRQSESKIRFLWKLLLEHRDERVLIFTHDNATAYHIGERFSLPVLTHQTKVKERRNMLGFFREGRWPWLVTSRVLNEGVDVPEVDIGIIVSGSGSVREHVQRLGRLLRKGKRERAKLVELISSGTGEEGRGRRRREHEAYR